MAVSSLIVRNSVNTQTMWMHGRLPWLPWDSKKTFRLTYTSWSLSGLGTWVTGKTGSRSAGWLVHTLLLFFCMSSGKTRPLDQSMMQNSIIIAVGFFFWELSSISGPSPKPWLLSRLSRAVPSGSPDSFVGWVIHPSLIWKISLFIVMSKLKLTRLSGMFSVFLQHYQTWMCVKGQTTANFR